MTVDYLKAKYGMTTLEATTFLFWNLKGFVANGMESKLLNALNKVK